MPEVKKEDLEGILRENKRGWYNAALWGVGGVLSMYGSGVSVESLVGPWGGFGVLSAGVALTFYGGIQASKAHTYIGDTVRPYLDSSKGESPTS